MGQIQDFFRLFQIIFQYILAPIQNVLKSDLKKSRICPVFRLSDPLWAQICHLWYRTVLFLTWSSVVLCEELASRWRPAPGATDMTSHTAPWPDDCGTSLVHGSANHMSEIWGMNSIGSCVLESYKAYSATKEMLHHLNLRFLKCLKSYVNYIYSILKLVPFPK